MEEVKLLGAWPSSFCYRVIWALKLKVMKYEYVEVNIHDKNDLLLQLNPVHKQVPVLVNGGRPIAESMVLDYPYERALARFWTKFHEDKSQTFFAYFHTVGEEQEQAIKEAKEILKILDEKGLGEKKFFGGNQIGLTDIAFGWIAGWLEAMEEAVGIKLLEPDSFPRLHSWILNFKEIPVIKENIPDHNDLLAYFKSLRDMFIASATS